MTEGIANALDAHWSLILWAIFGAMVHWIGIRYGKSMDSSVEMFIDELSTGGAIRLLLKMTAVSAVGSIIAYLLTDPATGRQAFASGMAWTTLVSGKLGSGTQGRVKGSK